jgi:hypothetical protein
MDMFDRGEVHLTPKQLSSSLVRSLAAARKLDLAARLRLKSAAQLLHFHDASQGEISWNDVQAIQSYNEFTGENLQVPLAASEGYNQHGHTGPYDGGYIPGMGPHDHRDNFNGGFAFAVYHPGTSIPQMPWAV